MLPSGGAAFPHTAPSKPNRKAYRTRKGNEAFGIMSTCVRGDETCQWPLFGERLVDTVYIGQTFTNYVNFILFAYIVLVFYVSSSYFPIPFYLYEMRYGKERKENGKFCSKILKIHFNDSRYKTNLGSYQTTVFGREDVAYKSESGQLKIMKICPTNISNHFD